MHNSIGYTGSGPTSAPPCWSDLLSKVHPSLESRFYKYTDTGSDMPTTPNNAWNDLGKILFLMSEGQLWLPTSWVASLTLETPQTPKPTLDWTAASSVSFNLRHQGPSGQTRKGRTTQNYSIHCACSVHHPQPQNLSFFRPGTRRMKFEENLSCNSNLSRQQPAQSEQASTSSSAYTNMGAQEPPLSETTPTHTTGSSLLEPWASSQSSGPRPLGSGHPDLGSPQKMSERTLSALAEPWPCTSPGSQIELSWPLDGADR